jgi:hypothetical protein
MEFCEWVEDDSGVWATDCGFSFEFNEGGPGDNKFEYCPFCGKNLGANPFVEETGDEDGDAY